MDMVRSLGVVLLIAAGLLYLHRAPAASSRVVRVIDPLNDVRAFQRAVPTAVVPGFLPATWRPTSSNYTAAPPRLRIGYVTPIEQYAEFDAQAGPPGTFVADLTAHGRDVGSVQAGGRTWREVRGSGGSLSLVWSGPELTVVLGSFRDSAPIEELTVLAESLTPRG